MRSVVCKAFKQIRETGRLKLFKSYRPEYPDGGQQRDFLYVKDAVAVMLWLLDHPEVNGIFNVGAGVARTWNDLAAAVFAAMAREAWSVLVVAGSRSVAASSWALWVLPVAADWSMVPILGAMWETREARPVYWDWTAARQTPQVTEVTA